MHYCPLSISFDIEPLTPENLLWHTPKILLHSSILTSPLSSAPSSLMLNNSEIKVKEREQSDSKEFENNNNINNKTISTGKAYHTQQCRKL